MTRTFNEKIRCPSCGHNHTAETAFERWVRNNRSLDSVRESIVRFDLDLLLHRYKTPTDGKGTRDIQCMMFIEIKTFMAKVSDAQRDTLSLLNQVMRNRKPNIHSNPRRQVKNQICRAYSKMLNKEVRLLLYGGHLLQMDGTCPNSSSLMLWDNKPIDPIRLEELLRFERDPDRPENKMDHRRRSHPWRSTPALFPDL